MRTSNSYNYFNNIYPTIITLDSSFDHTLNRDIKHL